MKIVNVYLDGVGDIDYFFNIDTEKYIKKIFGRNKNV